MSSLKHLFSNAVTFKKYINLSRNFRRIYSTNKKSIILGIETSCDDTGCAIVDSEGNILGESLHSQQDIHLNLGGIIPPLAQSFHRKNIERVVNEAVTNSGLSFQDIDAVATTVKPGLPLSLIIGTKYGKHLCRTYNKPFIPIHHMKAHALTIRMVDPTVQFPFLVLLISGGHCLLAIAKTVDEFILLGQSLDDAPGEAFDKTARRLKLRNIPEFANLSGGPAIELAASKADNPLQFEYSIPMTAYKDCNFSFSGLKNKALSLILKEEKNYGIEPDEVIPHAYNVCAGFQLAVTRHLCHRTQRAMEYIDMKDMLPKEKLTMVVSGGAACNNYIFKGLQLICDEFGYRLVRPPPKLCTDNGVMIAWNGVEKWRANSDITNDLDSIQILSRAPLGTDISEEVAKEKIKCKWIRLTRIVELKNTADSL